jgi:hypothetical protein
MWTCLIATLVDGLGHEEYIYLRKMTVFGLASFPLPTCMVCTLNAVQVGAALRNGMGQWGSPTANFPLLAS